jgi:fucose 4-O-acetylase-like acetyltransferase
VEKRTARNWYWWLWLSPLVTVSSLASLLLIDPGFELVCGGIYRGCDRFMAERVTILIAVLGSALWHLILLFPALNEKSEFVRWHGRQALLLAGVRTAVPLVFGLAFGLDEGALLFIPVLIAVWFFSTLWGQIQAAHGNCSLMRWFGRTEALPSSVRADEPAQTAEMNPAQIAELDPEALVDIIRYSRDPERRRKALAELETLGMVEPL